MSLTPIKLLRNGPNKTRLLKIKEETADIDMMDYIESRINTNTAARKLMAIEDATEMAKQFLLDGTVLERIGDAIKKEADHTLNFSCRREKGPRKGIKYIQLEKKYPNTQEGHFAMAKVNHNTKTVELYDSMGKQNPEFKKDLRSQYINYTIIPKGLPFQPSGGFVYKTATEFKVKAKARFKTDEALMKSFEISQYDELSQHHFCYIEAFIILMNKTLGTPLGPLDPRDRLPFVKKVVWGLVHKFIPMSKRNTPEWKYFVKNFRYYMTVTDDKNRRLKLQDIVQMSPNGIRRKVMKMNLPDNITNKTTLKEIVSV